LNFFQLTYMCIHYLCHLYLPPPSLTPSRTCFVLLFSDFVEENI
jgi:hypothetical protein